MHRSRLSVLVIFAAAAACSTHDDSSTTDLLARDPSLVARIEADREPPRSPLPSVCVAATTVAASSAANKTQSAELTRRAYDAELLGNVAEANSLLLRATALDGTNMSAAYHLGRTSETLGDRAGATSAYCRYLALTPTTAESNEVRQRVAKLSQPEGGVSASNASLPATRPSAHTRVSAPRARHQTVAYAPHTTPRREVSSNVASSATANGDVVASSSQTPSVEPSPATYPTSPTSPRAAGRTSNRVQSAGIGAMAGAILGAATGRSVKSTMIGAAAGGILGAVVSHGGRAGG